MRFSGLRKAAVLLCAPLVLLSFFGCNALNDADGGGMLSLTMPAARYAVSDVDYYTVSVYRIKEVIVDEDDIEREHRYYIADDERVKPGKTFTVKQVEPAVWTVKVNAWTASDELAGEGSSEVTVERGKSARATVSVSLYKDINADVQFSPALTVSDMYISDTSVTVQLSNYTVNAETTAVQWYLNGFLLGSGSDYPNIIDGISEDGKATFRVDEAIQTTVIKLGTNTLSLLIFENDILAGSAIAEFELLTSDEGSGTTSLSLTVPDMSSSDSSVTVRLTGYTVSSSNNVIWYLNGTEVGKDDYEIIYGINNDGTRAFSVEGAIRSGLLNTGSNTLKVVIYESSTLVGSASATFTYTAN